MGWASGSELAERVWDRIENKLKEEDKPQVALDILEEFEEEDCDTMYECDFVKKYLEYDEEEGEWKIK